MKFCDAAWIRLGHATLGYPGHAILERVHFDLPKGAFALLTGPNGGGKTTLLKTMAGILPLLKGNLQEPSGGVGYVPQFEKLDPVFPITAFEVVEVTGANPENCHAALELCHADKFSKKLFTQLSGGQRQRVLMARALATKPEGLLLDEPTSGIDRETRSILAALLGKLNREQGMTIVLVCHETALFENMATHQGQVMEGMVTLKKVVK